MLPLSPSAAKGHDRLLRWVAETFGPAALGFEPIRRLVVLHYGCHALAATGAYLQLCHMESHLAAEELTPIRIFKADLKALHRLGGLNNPAHISLRSVVHIAYLKYGLLHDPEAETKGWLTHPERLNKLPDQLSSGKWVRSRIQNVIPLIEELYGRDDRVTNSRHYRLLATAMGRVPEIQRVNYFSEVDKFIRVALHRETERFLGESEMMTCETNGRLEMNKLAARVAGLAGSHPPLFAQRSSTPKNKKGQLTSLSQHAASNLRSCIGRSILDCKERLHDFVWSVPAPP